MRRRPARLTPDASDPPNLLNRISNGDSMLLALFKHLRTNVMKKSNVSRIHEKSIGFTCQSRASLFMLFPILGTLSIAGCGGGVSSDDPSLIQRFAASSPTITAGQITTLSWQASGSKSVSLSGVTATPVASAVVAPSQTTTYHLTATSEVGKSTTRDVTVTVAPATTVGSVTVNPAQPGRAIPSGFLGFSHEWGQAQLLLGSPAVPNPVYRQLIANLEQYGGGPVSLRIGGSSTDSTGEPDANTVPPFAQMYADSKSMPSGVSFILGVNFKAGNVTLATDQATAYLKSMPSGSVQAVEIGNEPDLYQNTTYPFSQFLTDFQTFGHSIQAANPGTLLMGPSIARFPNTQLSKRLPPRTDFATTDQLNTFIQQEASSLALVSWHAYVTAGANAGNTVPSGFLLQPTSSTLKPSLVAAYVPLATAAGKPFRMAEMNSLSSSGQDGVSNAFEAALWAVDTMFEFANVGISGVNFHSNNWNSFNQWDAYGAFHFNVPESQYLASKSIAPPSGTQFSQQYSLREVQSLYYGMLLFAESTGHQSKLLPVDLQTNTNVKAWATIDPTTNKVNVLVLNKDQSASGVVSLTIPGYSSGVVTRMIAPTLSSKTGITLGGQTFDGSQDGKAVGVEYGETITGEGGKFTVSSGAASAFLLTLSK